MYEFAVQLDEYYKPVKHFLTEDLFQKIVISKFFRKQEKKISKSSNELKKISKKTLKYYVDPIFLNKIQKKSKVYKSKKNSNKKKTTYSQMLKTMSKPTKYSIRILNPINYSVPMVKPTKYSVPMSKTNYRRMSKNRKSSLKYNRNAPRYIPNYLMAHGGGDQNNEYTFMNSAFIPLVLFAIFQLFRINARQPPNRYAIREIRDISGDKERVRLVFSLVKDNGHMDFLKVSALEYDTTKEEILQNPQILYDDFGEYVYECRIYDEMKQNTGVTYKGKDISNYVSEILDWNIKEIDLTNYASTDTFIVNGVNINSIYPNGLCTKIYQNNWTYPSPHNKYCYSLVKGYPNFINYSEYINNQNYTHLQELFENGISLLKLFWNNKQYIHWDLHYDNLLVNPNNGEVKFFDFDFSEVYDSLSIRNRILTHEIDSIIDFFKLLHPNQNQHMFDNFDRKLLGHIYDYYRFVIEPLEYDHNYRQYITNNLIPAYIKANPGLSWYRKIVTGFIDLGIFTVIDPPNFNDIHVNYMQHAARELKHHYRTMLNSNIPQHQKDDLRTTIDFNKKMMTALYYFYNIE